MASQQDTNTTAPEGAAPIVAQQQEAGANAPVGSFLGSSSSLYVGDLAPDVTEALLFEVFNAVGPVASVRVCRDAQTRRSLGYAYINFHRAEDAERALDTMNFTNIRGRQCRIMWSHRDPTLRKTGKGNIFVKNLAPTIDNKTLYDTFSMFGNILSCKVSMNQQGESLGYGFVHYESEEAANNAIANVNGMVIAEQKVVVEPFRPRSERGSNNRTFTNLFVKNVPEEKTQEELEALFAAHGTITSAVLVMDRDDPSKHRGFGFVNFETPEQAVAAIEALNGHEWVEDKPLFVGRAQKRAEREKELRKHYEQLRLEQQRKWAGVNLYVKNLHESIDTEQLKELFEPHGTITSARVMMDEANERSRGFGFVCFSAPEEATKAVTEMNGKMVEGKPLYVALAQRKDVRRAQLEAQYAARSKLAGPQPGMYGQGPAPYFGLPGVPGIPPRMMYPGQMNPAGMPMRPGMPVARGAGPMPGWPAGVGPQGAYGRGMPMYMPQGGANMPGGRGAGRGAQNGGQRRKGAGRGQQPNNPNYRYTQQARNAGMQQMPNEGAPAQASAAPAQGKGGIDLAALAAAPEEEQKRTIGEHIYPLIAQVQPALAGKITGMLLEMDLSELLILIEDNSALNAKVAEALEVLREHSEQSTE